MSPEYDMRLAWNQSSAAYQQRHRIPTHSVRYGPFAPTEDELQLLGDVQGLQILDLGCGGGQTSLAFAKQGAKVVGLDLSDSQLTFARALAKAEKISVRFVQGHGEDLAQFANGTQDLVFAAYVFLYIDDIAQCLAECRRVLAPGGRLVVSLDHPIFDCFFDEEEAERSLTPTTGYFDNRSLLWPFASGGVIMKSRRYAMSQWFDVLSTAGFKLETFCEPQVPKDTLDEMWPEDGPHAPLRNLPHTIILVARRPVE